MDLFKNNTTIKDAEINIQINPGHYPVKQQARPIPLRLQEEVGKELDKLIKTGHIEKVKHVDEDCFVLPVVITVKIDKTVEFLLDSKKLKWQLPKIQTSQAEYERIIEPEFGRNYERPNKRTDDIKKWPGLRTWPNETIKRDKPTMRLCKNQRQF